MTTRAIVVLVVALDSGVGFVPIAAGSNGNIVMFATLLDQMSTSPSETDFGRCAGRTRDQGFAIDIAVHVYAELEGQSTGGITGAEFYLEGWETIEAMGYTVSESFNPSATVVVGSMVRPVGGVRRVTIGFPTCQQGPYFVFLGAVHAQILGSLPPNIPANTSLRVIAGEPGSPCFPCRFLSLCDSPEFTRVCSGGGEFLINQSGVGGQVATRIDDFNPTCGPAGTQVLITGYFGDVTSVEFNGVGASFTVNSTLDSIRAIVPPGATSGPIHVGAGCGRATTSKATFCTLDGNCASPLTLAFGDQLTPAAAPDGSGGMIVAWTDERGAKSDIYVQRMNAIQQSLWTTDGVALCTAHGQQVAPAIVSDGAGGAIITWYDSRGPYGKYDIYVQRVSATGTPLWTTTDGVAVCTAEDDQKLPTIVADGAGGAIITWYDDRNLSQFYRSEIYAQRVNAAGAPQWAADGVALCTVFVGGVKPRIVSDGAGGAIVAWEDHRNYPYNADVYAQRVSGTGVPQWTADGVAVCTAVGDQFTSTLVSDGAGGAIIAWDDHRGSDYDVYAQRLSAAGSPQWTADGVGLSTSTGDQSGSRIVSDDAGGAIVAWHDYRSGPNNPNIFVQRVNGAGVSQWTAVLCAAPNEQTDPAIIPDGAGGAIVCWNDHRSGTNYDVYAQRVDASGSPEWGPFGTAMCAQPWDQNAASLVTDGMGGAMLAWQDSRSGACIDILGARVSGVGALGVTPGASQDRIAIQAWPNPFTDRVRITFSLWTAMPVGVQVFDVAGRQVWSMPATVLGPGRHTVDWDGHAEKDSPMAQGIYFLRLRGPSLDTRRTLVRLK